MDNNDVRNHELIAIQTECREQLLAQLKANGLTPFEFYAWALARDLETEAAEQGISVKRVCKEDYDANADDPGSMVDDLYAEIEDQLRQLGHEL